MPGVFMDAITNVTYDETVSRNEGIVFRWLATFRVFCLALPFGIMCADPAHACMSHETFPVYWNQPPLFPKSDIVILRVTLEANTQANPDRAFTSSCDGPAYVFKVTEVLHGAFSGKEIAVVLPVSGEIYNQPADGHTRIVVGRILPDAPFGDRFIVTEANVATGEFDTPVAIQTTAGRSSLPVLDFREPPEGRIIVLLSRPDVWFNLVLALSLGALFIGAVWLLRGRAR